MNQLLEPRRIVRPLGRHERIPSLSTIDLLLTPIHTDPKPLGINEIRVMQSDARFEPHVDMIRSMIGEGKSLRKIAAKMGTTHKALGAYIQRNHSFHVSGGIARGAQQKAKCVARFEPLRDRIHQLVRAGTTPQIIADLVGVPYTSLYRYLQRQRTENAES